MNKQLWGKKGKLGAIVVALLAALIFTATPALAAGQAQVKIANPTGFTAALGAAWDGVLVDVAVDVSPGMTMQAAVETALTAKVNGVADYSIDASGGYLSEINGLASMSATFAGQNIPGFEYWDGWVGSINGVMPGVGFGQVYVRDGDDILIEFSLDSTMTNNAVWGGYNPADITELGFSAGKLITQGSGWSVTYTLNLPYGVPSVQVTDVPGMAGAPVFIYLNDDATAYAVGDDVPVADGDQLLIVVGDYDNSYLLDVHLIDAGDLDTIIDNIAAGAVDQSGEWWLLDMAAYRDRYPGASVSSSQTAVQTYIDKTAQLLLDDPSEINCAKAILVMTALGYAADELTLNGVPLDAAALLEDYDFVGLSEYVAPWVLLADLQGLTSLTATQTDNLIASLCAAQKPGGLFGYSYGGYDYVDVDGTAMAVAALASYQDASPAAAAFISAALPAMANELLPGGGFGNANTNAMVILALTALGRDPATDAAFTSGGVSLLDALLLDVDADLSGFLYFGSANDLATEQAFRALLAAKQAASVTPAQFYDFSGNVGSLIAPKASLATGAARQVEFLVLNSAGQDVTQRANIRVYDYRGLPVADSGTKGVYQLPFGEYSYRITYLNYATASDGFTVTDRDLQLEVPLTEIGVQVKFRLIGDDKHGDSGHVSYTTWSATRTYRMSGGDSAWDLIRTALNKAKLSYTYSNGYLSAVSSPLTGAMLREFDNGKKSGWMYAVFHGKKETDVSMTALADYQLNDGDLVVLYYTDDYTKTYRGFDVEDVDPQPVSMKDALEQTIRDAEALLKATPVSVDGSDVAAGLVWTTDKERQKLQRAIDDAEQALNAKGQNEADYRKAVNALADAMDQFKKKCQPGKLAVVAFADVPTTHWAYSYIQTLAGRGVATGYDGCFYPDQPIRRADFVTLLARLSGEALPAAGSTFRDVAADAYYAAAVSWAAAAGISGGYEDQTFRPQELISRQDMATMLYRYAAYRKLTLPATQAAPVYGDRAAIAAYAADAVDALGRAGIVQGDDQGNFRPHATASRAETAKMMCLIDTLQ